MVIKGKQVRDTKVFPWAGRVGFGSGSRGCKRTMGNRPQDMQWPFIQEQDGGPGQGPACPHGVCLKFAL